ncbi:MAG: Hsp20/alpha crystallin family protein [Pirellulaceae bacterium]
MSATTISNNQPHAHESIDNNHAASQNAARAYTPRFDLWEGDEEFVLYGDMPGVSPDSLDIRFEEGRLTIHGRVELPSDRKYTSAEYGIGDFYREFLVGESVNPEEITAEMKDGVVTIHLQA